MCSPQAYLAMAVGNVLLARSQMKSEIAFAEAEAEAGREQIKDERVQNALETAEKLNVRKEEMATRLATNRALLSPAGITADSYSFRALLAHNKAKSYKDLRNIGLTSAQTLRDISYTEADVEHKLLSTKIGAKNRFYGQVLQSGQNIHDASKGVNWGNSKSKGSGEVKPFKGPNYKQYSQSNKSMLKRY